VVNLCAALSSGEPEQIEKIAIAAAFHDLGIWTDGTFDYLQPSIRLVDAHLTRSNRAEWMPEITAMISSTTRFQRTGAIRNGSSSPSAGADELGEAEEPARREADPEADQRMAPVSIEKYEVKPQEAEPGRRVKGRETVPRHDPVRQYHSAGT
jgi:hypothetical protein